MENIITKKGNMIVKNFGFVNSNITVVKEGDNVWFRGKDAALALGYKDTGKAIRNHVNENEKKMFFLDSFQFMASGLDRLVANVPEDAFKFTSKQFQADELKLMKQKGVYPYDYMDGFDKFNDKTLLTR